jgi:tRNA1Val (adenine37-N6)-methyltransferase
MELLTKNTFFNGLISVNQSRNGYRFSIDSVLLAGHVGPYPGNRVIDLGTGCGIIPLILASRYLEIKIYGIEIQEQLSQIAQLNVEENRMEERISIICKDIKALCKSDFSGHVDLILSNPPYRKNNSGRISANEQKAVAKHEIKVTLADVIEAAGRLLDISGRLIIIYPAGRMVEVLAQMRTCRIEPKKIRCIHSKNHTEAELAIVEGIKGAQPGVHIAHPLIIYNNNGQYTNETKKMYEPFI